MDYEVPKALGGKVKKGRLTVSTIYEGDYEYLKQCKEDGELPITDWGIYSEIVDNRMEVCEVEDDE